MNLSTLTDALERDRLLIERIGSTGDRPILRLTNDSRSIEPDQQALFIAVSGEITDGHLYIDRAIQHGAAAIVCEQLPDAVDLHSEVPILQVQNSRFAQASLASEFYGHPARGMILIGITGTNGKTTTSFLIHHLLTRLGESVGLIGTVLCRIGTDECEASLTTPDVLDLYALLRQMKDAGCTSCVMEVSSHALEQERVGRLDFEVGVFTNLSRDHLDYHGTFEAYLGAKKRLFDHIPAHGSILYNIDDPSSPLLLKDAVARKMSYGVSESADLRLEILENRMEGLRLRIDGHEQRFNLVGDFNAYNIAAAYAVAMALGLNPVEAIDALSTAPSIPGRFEIFRFENGCTGIVDYAHTPDALENVLTTVLETKNPSSRLWCVFGCGGDRDRGKRPLMGRSAETHADVVVVTSDNPRTEPPERILQDIRDGMEAPEKALWIPDRASAIRYAASHCRPGDVVLVAGKGHETYQITGSDRRHFDDREEIRAAFDTENHRQN